METHPWIHPRLSQASIQAHSKCTIKAVSGKTQEREWVRGSEAREVGTAGGATWGSGLTAGRVSPDVPPRRCNGRAQQKPHPVILEDHHLLETSALVSARLEPPLCTLRPQALAAQCSRPVCTPPALRGPAGACTPNRGQGGDRPHARPDQGSQAAEGSP